jgi:hypothetical protein
MREGCDVIMGSARDGRWDIIILGARGKKKKI